MSDPRRGARPVVGVIAAPGTGARVRPLLAMTARRCRVGAGIAGDAVFATSPTAPGVALADPDRLGVWVQDGQELAALTVSPAVVVTPSAEVAAAAGPAGLVVPAHGIDPLRHPPVAPFVRARWRRLLDLPPELVIVAGDDAVDAAAGLALASAAVVGEPWLLVAMALGTPLVTDPASARAVDAEDEVAVADDHEAALAAADALSTDPVAAAAAGRRARRAIDDRHDLRAAADALLDRLGLAPAGHRAPVGRRLDELHTPASAPIRRRTAAALSLLEAP